MSSTQQQPNKHGNFRASIFKNNFKKEDKQPDFTGSVEIEGQPYKIAMWERKDKNGNPFFSFGLTPDNFKTNKAKTSTPEDELGGGDDSNPFAF